jgi:uncharacterized protein (TIGR03437 family)
MSSISMVRDSPILRAALLPLICFYASSGCNSRREVIPEVTSHAKGPYRILGNKILDADNQLFLIRGTHVERLREDVKTNGGFDPLSATALATIRQRLNMNAVRVAIDPGEYVRSEKYRESADHLLHLANDFELVVIFEAANRKIPPEREFWFQIASRLRNERNVFFAPLRSELIAPLRSAGARQPAIVEGSPRNEKDLIYQITAGYTKSAEAWNHVRLEANDVPVLADDFDPQLDRANGECAAFPADPAEATKLVHDRLVWFDEQQISWTLSSFTLGHLITDYSAFNGTKLDDGWRCGKPGSITAGLGMVILSHLWRASPLGLFVVSQSRGGIELARGGIATAYGPTLADQDMQADSPLPVELGNLAVQIVDSRGVAQLAPLLYAGAGWSFVNFIVPEACATGPADLAILRKDGSTVRSHVVIRDVAPALLTAAADGRGAGIAFVTQEDPDRRKKTFQAWTCEGGCRNLLIPLANDVSTTVQFLGSGFRHVRDKTSFHATAGGIEVPVLSSGPGNAPGNDQLTIAIPNRLIGAGKVEFYFRVDGELSNVVTINFGRRSKG